MTYRDGTWGAKARARSLRRRDYFRTRSKAKYKRKDEANSGLARKAELLAVDFLSGSVLDNCSSHDVLWQGKRVEVKVSSIHWYGYKPNKKRKMQQGWSFNTKRQHGRADIFFLVCLATDKKTIVGTYIVPDSKPVKYLSVTSDRLEPYRVNTQRKELITNG